MATRATRTHRRVARHPVPVAVVPRRTPSTRTSRSRAPHRPPHLRAGRPLPQSAVAATRAACRRWRRPCHWRTHWLRWATSTLWPALASLRVGLVARRMLRTWLPRLPLRPTCLGMRPPTRRPTCLGRTAGPEHWAPKGGATERGASYATCSLLSSSLLSSAHRLLPCPPLLNSMAKKALHLRRESRSQCASAALVCKVPVQRAVLEATAEVLCSCAKIQQLDWEDVKPRYGPCPGVVWENCGESHLCEAHFGEVHLMRGPNRSGDFRFVFAFYLSSLLSLPSRA